MPTGPRRFRPEIQLLRALAVLVVVVYHVNPDWLPGGFVGVDVFFVISGFLITGHMLGEVERTGRLSLLGFWANRARRILPAATVTILAVVVTAPFFLPATQWEAVADQGIASAFYVQNFALADKSVDYLAQDAADTPFQHFWSLSVEEQFYVLWPLLVLLALLVVGRLRRAGGARHLTVRRLTCLFMSLVVLASFLYSVAEVNAGEPTAYFVTPTRVWELGIGGVLACVLGDPRVFPRLRTALGVAGFAAILLAAITYDAQTPFPGAAALLPVLGCVAVIASGRSLGDGLWHALVHWRPAQAIGAWSYSLYLWHFPVITYYVAVVGHHPGVRNGSVLVLVCLVLAYLSHRYVENPVRRLDLLRRRQWVTVGAALVSMVVAAVLSLVPQAAYAQYLAEQRTGTAELQEEVAREDREGFGAGSLDGDTVTTFLPGYEDVILPVPSEVADDTTPWDACQGASDSRSATTPECVAANPEGERTLVVVGDSHADQWVPAIRAAVEGTNWKVVTFLHEACPFNTEKRTLAENPEFPCTGPNEETLDRILELEPEAVMMTNLAVDDMAPDSTEEHKGTRGYVEVMEPMAEAGIRVVALHDTPTPKDEENVAECVVEHRDDPRACDLDRAETQESARTNAALEAAAAQVDGVEFVRPTDLFCTSDTCPAVIGNVLVYRDQNHVSATYMSTLGEETRDILGL